MLARYQMILRQGKPRIDLGILRLDYNFNNLYMVGSGEKNLYENQIMRANEGVYWQDMGLQNVGYTFDYFAPQILEDENITYASGEVAPEGPGYKALIIYQEALPLSSAKRILAWAKEGLPVILVNGTTEKIRPAVSKTHGKAASHTPFNDENDAELAEVMKEMKSLSNVAELDDQSKTNEALRSLGVYPRAAFSEPNKNILTALREDGDKRYLFVYNYLYTQKENFSFVLSLEGAGKPYCVNCWTGEVEEPGRYVRDAAGTTVPLSLAPGEAALLVVNTAETDKVHAVDINGGAGGMDGGAGGMGGGAVFLRDGELILRAERSGRYTTTLNDGSEVKTEITVPDNILLKTWELEVEDWDEGEKKTIVEDRGRGIVTREVYYETKKTRIAAGRIELKPWKDIPALGPAVSGVGYYTTAFTLPENWNAGNGAVLSIESTNGNSAAVYVNGKKAPAFDFSGRRVDISALLVPGENTVTVEVASTLNNRLLSRNYHAQIEKTAELMAQALGEETEGMDEMAGMMNIKRPEPQDYGMTGEVKLITYTVRTVRGV
jgi:hypothetical protein